jgi:hypothetical protein
MFAPAHMRQKGWIACYDYPVIVAPPQNQSMKRRTARPIQLGTDVFSTARVMESLLLAGF